MSDVVLQARQVVAGFGASTVLHGVDLTVERGACVGIFGLNGAGKSVTMKTLAGLVPVRSGLIEVCGEDVTDLPPEARVPRGVAYLPQARQLFPQLTVEQNLRLGGYVMRRRDKSRYAGIVDGVYDRFPRLAERRTQLAGSMSGGEQAMLAIGRALVSAPQILLIDEPSAGLAPAVMDDVLAMLLQLRSDGLTIVLVEQNIGFGFRLVERAAIMQRGLVVYEGEVGQLDTARVAELLGVGRLLSRQLTSSTSRGSTVADDRPPQRRAARK